MGVRLEADGATGPALNLELMPGQTALVLHPKLEALHEMIRLAMRQARPASGEMSWGPRAGPHDSGLWGELRFNRGVGLVHRNMALVPGRTVLEHLAIFFSYNLDVPPQEILPRSYGVLRSLGVHGREWREMRKSLPGMLPARLKRLGLYAIAIAKEPWLYVLERPAGHLGPDFPKLWRILERDRVASGSAVLVLDNALEPAYAESGLIPRLALGDVGSAGAPDEDDEPDEF
ncbi:MAG: hypothetical protein LBQ12_16130 [Deltaproteobacteria bacterium]|jgi:ABC-type ATPase involved in cell division|nr:hypothetical protein [Deltaproteobacteria bacterium]